MLPVGRKYWSMSPAPCASGAHGSSLKDFFQFRKKVMLDLVLENAENILLTFLQFEEVRNESVLRAASNCCSTIC